MGDEVGDLWKGCHPVHTVTLTYNYWVGIYEVTFGEYDAFCLSANRPLSNDQGWGRGERPVINVTWRDAISYCNWLSEQKGLQPAYTSDGKLKDFNGNITKDITQVEGYRLLTEAEWEYAASGGHKALPLPPRFLFAGSDDLDEVGWFFDNSGDELIYTGSHLNVDYTNHGAAQLEGKSSHPVGEKKPNQLGIFDMSGNVWEWCHDLFGAYTPTDKVNPLGALTGHTRVIRGGSWIFGSGDCRVANRLYRPPHEKIFRLGFRLARTEL